MPLILIQGQIQDLTKGGGAGGLGPVTNYVFDQFRSI